MYQQQEYDLQAQNAQWQELTPTVDHHSQIPNVHRDATLELFAMHPDLGAAMAAPLEPWMMRIFQRVLVEAGFGELGMMLSKFLRTKDQAMEMGTVYARIEEKLNKLAQMGTAPLDPQTQQPQTVTKQVGLTAEMFLQGLKATALLNAQNTHQQYIAEGVGHYDPAQQIYHSPAGYHYPTNWANGPNGQPQPSGWGFTPQQQGQQYGDPGHPQQPPPAHGQQSMGQGLASAALGLFL